MFFDHDFLSYFEANGPNCSNVLLKKVLPLKFIVKNISQSPERPQKQPTQFVAWRRRHCRTPEDKNTLKNLFDNAGQLSAAYNWLNSAKPWRIDLFGQLNVATNSNPLGIKRFVSGIPISFKCECHIIVQIQYTKNVNLGRFELGTTLS